MEQNKRIPSPALVEQYRRQMLALYQPASTAPTPETENWLDHRFPEPDPIRDRETIAPPAPPVQPEKIAAPPPTASPPFVGYLRVFAFTGEGAEPWPDAQVTVSRDGTVYANVVTDRDGYTPAIPLPSVDPALSLSPGGVAPYVTYTLLISATGFRPVRHENVPVYGNNYVTQPVALHPLIPGTQPERTQTFVSGGPTTL